MLRLLACSLAALLAAALPACGPDDSSGHPPYGRMAHTPEAAEAKIFVGQEIWLTYESPEHAHIGIRAQRTREAARALAEDLRAQVLKGADIGVLATVHSNAPGARADGFSGVLPRDPNKLDDRDRALMRAPIGGVTDLVDWNGGWWFAKRTSSDFGRNLERVFRALVQAGKEANKTRVRARAITLAYKGSWPFRGDVDPPTLEQAKHKALNLLVALKRGADFGDLAKAEGWDKKSSERGGELLAFDEPGKGGRWISRLDSGYPNELLKVLFEVPVGLVAEPIVTARGVVVVELLERREVTPEELR